MLVIRKLKSQGRVMLFYTSYSCRLTLLDPSDIEGLVRSLESSELLF